MIEKALKYLVGMGKAEIHHENKQVYSDKDLFKLSEPTANALKVHSLSGLVDYLKSHVDGTEPVIVHVVSPTEVRVSSALNCNKNRDYFIKAEALIPQFHFDSWYDAENFNIKLQSCFVENAERDVMLKVVGNIKEENVRSTNDDGVTQAVVAKTSVTSVGVVQVPNPVEVAPYRTFVEVSQPESSFIFRMKDGPSCALFEADGGQWKHEAINNIKKYLETNLTEDITHSRIHIIA